MKRRRASATPAGSSAIPAPIWSRLPWTRPGADEGFSTAWLPTDTGPINSLLSHDNDDTNDIPAAATMAQIDWRPDINTPPSKSQSCTINFQSAVNKGDETPSAPEILFAAHFIQNRFDLTGFTGDLANSILDRHTPAMLDMRTSFAASASELINLALTLHRDESVGRDRGLALFERLLALNVYGTRQSLLSVDARPVVGAAFIFWRRKRRVSRTRGR